MKRPRIVLAGVAVAALATAGGLTAASASGSAMPSRASAAVVRTAQATVGGKTETILVNTQGLPLYTYRPDTASTSFVGGGLARLWPPLISATAPVVGGPGVTGKVGALRDINGQQVTYNGHPLYTFVDDRAGQVTGQGVQNFFVATPGITSLGAAAGSGAPAAPAAPAGGFGY
jgi:predicted lipoprotein with Yx(FWY)xxD motif